jgi:hypothetical protein
LVPDAGFGAALLQEQGATRYVVRVGKNRTFRRATPPPSAGRGRPPTRGAVVRPLPRRFMGRAIPATPRDDSVTRHNDGVLAWADVWTELILPTAAPGSPTFAVSAVHDPHHREPLLLASPLPVPP